MAILCGDARCPPFKFLSARLIWADPPTNRGMNEGTASDRITGLEYQQFAIDWLNTSVKFLANDAWFIICCYAKLRPLYERLMLKYGLVLDQEIIWHYGFGLYTNYRFVPSHDNLLVYKIGKPKFHWEAVAIESQRQQVGDSRADPRGRPPGSVWDIPRVPGNSFDRTSMTGDRRSCQPEELCERILLAYTAHKDWVYEPFMGSGSMARICRKYKRRYIGIDICEEYVHEVDKRLNNAKELLLRLTK